MPGRTSANDPIAHRNFAIVSSLLLIGLSLLASLMAAVGPDTDLYEAGYTLFTMLVVIFMPLGVASSVYLWRIFLQDTRTRRSWLLLRDAVIGTGLTVVSLFVGITSVLRLAGLGPFPWAAPFYALCVVLVAGITTYMAAIYWLRRRASGDGTPPPIVD